MAAALDPVDLETGARDGEVISNRRWPRVRHFVGRESELAKIHELLHARSGSRAIVTLHGLGGMGKTQLAAAYSTNYWNEYSAIFWLNSRNADSIKLTFCDVATSIMTTHPAAAANLALASEENPDDAIDAVKK
jgi:hypothetical protein